MGITESRARRLLIWFFACLCAVIAWTALTLSFGGSNAHAAERPAGLLDDLTSTTSQAVTDLVEELVAPIAPAASGTVADTVAQVTEPVLAAVASLPVAGPAAAGVVEGTTNTALDTVEAIVAPVVRTLGDEPISRAVDPLLGALEQLPLAGSLVGSLDHLLVPAVGGLDTVLGSIGGVAASTVDSLDPDLLQGDDPGANPSAAAMPERGAPSGLSVFLRSTSLFTGANIPESSVEGPSAPFFEPLGPPGAPPGQNSTVPTSSASSGGGSGGSVARVASAESLLLRDWERATDARNDDLPPSPVFDTDVSPD